VLVRFAYLAVTHAFAALRLLPMTDREKDIEILALRHQLTILQRQLGDQRPQLRPEDRASSPLSLRRWPAQLCADSDCWSAPTQSCGGIVTW
jgi:hypothetical protein